MPRWHKTRTRVWVIVALAFLATLGAIIAFTTQRSDVVETRTWPPLVMTYNIDVRTYKGEHVREVHRLIYESESDWTDTVTESDPIQSGAGTVYSVGSYRRLNGTRYEEYDSINDHYIVETVADNVLMAPNAFARPISVPYLKSKLEEAGKGSFESRPTSARACYRQQCRNSVDGLSVPIAAEVGWAKWIFSDDPRWGIPLKVGDLFTVEEIVIDSVPPSTD